MTDRQPLFDHAAGYRFKPHEMPILPGSPANPDHPGARRAAYLAIGIFIGLLGGSQNGFLLANSGAVQAEFALTPVEAGWLTVAFYSTYSCLSMLLFRVRQHFGIQPFVRWAMAGLVAANFVQMIGPGYYPELVARAVAGRRIGGADDLLPHAGPACGNEGWGPGDFAWPYADRVSSDEGAVAGAAGG